MSNTFETLEGELNWVRTKTPEMSPAQFKSKPTDPDKYFWKTMLRPTQDSLIKIMDMQAKGVKNKLGKDDKGYYINFNRPVETFDKNGRVKEKFNPPKVYKADGSTEITDLVGNGSKGFVKIELYEHGAPGGKKAHAARLDSIMVTELVPYGNPA